VLLGTFWPSVPAANSPRLNKSRRIDGMVFRAEMRNPKLASIVVMQRFGDVITTAWHASAPVRRCIGAERSRGSPMTSTFEQTERCPYLLPKVNRDTFDAVHGSP